MIQKKEKNLPKMEKCSVQQLPFSQILSVSAWFTQFYDYRTQFNQMYSCNAVLTKHACQVSRCQRQIDPSFPNSKRSTGEEAAKH